MVRIFIVEDQTILSNSIKEFLESKGYMVVGIVDNGEDAISQIINTKPDLVLMDIILNNDVSGHEVAKAIHKSHSVPIIYLSSTVEDIEIDEVLADGIYGVLSKSISFDELLLNIEIALRRFEKDQKVKYDKYFLKEAQRLSQIGHWKLDLRTNKLEWSDETYRIFNLDKEKHQPSYETFLELIYPEDRDLVNEAYSQSVANKSNYEIEHRLIVAGEIRYVIEKGETFYDHNDDPVISLGTVQDITDRKIAQAELSRKKNAQNRTHKIINQLLSLSVDVQNVNVFLKNSLDILLELPFLGKIQRGAIYLTNESGLLEMATNRNFPQDKLAKCSLIDTGDCVCHKMFKSKEAQFFCCEVEDETKFSLLEENEVNYNIPIIHNDILLGSLCLYSDIKSESKDNLELLSAIGRSLGLMLVKFKDQHDLRISEDRFKELTATLEVVFWLVDWKSNRVIYVSPTHKKLYDQELDELFENPEAWKKRIHPSDRDFVANEYRTKVTKGEYDVEFRIVLDDGSIKWVHERAYPIKVDGEIVRIAGYVTNITDKKRMEVELKESEEKYKTYVENSADVISIVDENFNISFNSHNNEAIFGYDAKENVGHDVSKLVHPDDKNKLIDSFDWLKVNPGSQLNVEYRFNHKNGEWIWIESSIKYMPDDSKDPYFIISSRDISTRKMIQEDLVKSEVRYRSLYNNNLAGLYRINKKGVIVECNDAFAKYLGFEFRTEVVGKHQEDLYQLDENLFDLLIKNDDYIFSHSNILQLNSGETIRLMQNLRLHRDEDGEPLFYEASSIDTTSLMEIEKEKKLIEVLPAEDPNPVLRVDYDLEVIYANESCLQLGERIVRDKDITSARLRRFLSGFIPKQKEKEEVELRIGRRFFLFTAVNILDQKYVNLYGTDITNLEESKAAHLQLSMDLEKLVQARTEELESTVDELNKEVHSRVEAQTSLQKSLSEKEVLLNEITHRVKNNLQVIASLLSLQKNSIENPESLELLSDTGHRIKSMALIHETLYRSSDFSQINFQAYLDSLIRYVLNSFDTRHIKINSDIEDVTLTIDTATSCGMIVMELITNCIKYAFPDKKLGSINLKLREEGDNYFALSINDDGVGLPEDFKPEESDSLGMQLVIGLAAQLAGEVKMTNDSGLKTEIFFQDTKKHKYE